MVGKHQESQHQNAQAARERISREHLAPRSQFEVFSEQLGFAVLFIAIFVLLVLAVNWVGFWFRASGNAVFLGQGPVGLGAFLLGFPYGLLVLLLIAFGLMLLVLRHYDVSYKHPFFLLTVIILGAFLLGLGLVRTGINERLAERVANGQFQQLAPIYTGKHEPFGQVTRRSLVGTVVAKTGTTLTVDARVATVTVRLEGARVVGKDVAIGDRIHAVGEQVGRT